MNLIEIKKVYKIYKTGKIKTTVLNNINLDIKKGEILVILGPSGSGKTTMLNVISGLDKITKGTIKYNGKVISKYRDAKMTRFRKKNLGFIFQTYNLLEHLNVYENVLVGASLGKAKIDIDKIIDRVGITKHKGALDEKTGKVVLESLVEANEKIGTTMIIVTHNPGIALIGDRIIKMNSGKIVEEIVNEKRTNPKDIPWG